MTGNAIKTNKIRLFFIFLAENKALRVGFLSANHILSAAVQLILEFRRYGAVALKWSAEFPGVYSGAASECSNFRYLKQGIIGL